MKNPFEVSWAPGYITADAQDRIAMVKKFTAEECWAACALNNLQKNVHQAIQVRLRKLAKETEAAK